MDFIEVQCPWCSEASELAVSPEDEGSLVEDCQVCCRPWQVWIGRGPSGAGRPRVRVERG